MERRSFSVAAATAAGAFTLKRRFFPARLLRSKSVNNPAHSAWSPISGAATCNLSPRKLNSTPTRTVLVSRSARRAWRAGSLALT